MSPTDRAMLQDLTTQLFEKARTIQDKRWRRYVLEEAQRIMRLLDPLESEIRLQNLVTVTGGVLQTAEGRAWLDGFLHRNGLKDAIRGGLE